MDAKVLYKALSSPEIGLKRKPQRFSRRLAHQPERRAVICHGCPETTLINETIADRPDDPTVDIYLYRGNYRSTWFAEGGYEPIAEAMSC